MKAIFAAILTVLGAVAVLGQEPASTSPPAPAPAPTESALVPVPAGDDPSAAPPVVRLPASPIAPPETGGEPVLTPAPVTPETASEVTWSGGTVDLRLPPSLLNIRTNVPVEPRGIVRRVARPERKGVGGFLAGFANLFNPFAPVAQGVESRPEHWYDGAVSPAPQPRGFRDERYHEPKTDLITVGLEKEVREVPAAGTSRGP